jgi:hypothetical protein
MMAESHGGVNLSPPSEFDSHTRLHLHATIVVLGVECAAGQDKSNVSPYLMCRHSLIDAGKQPPGISPARAVIHTAMNSAEGRHLHSHLLHRESSSIWE